MKKLVALVAVLALSGVASAGLSLSAVQVGSTNVFIIDVVATAGTAADLGVGIGVWGVGATLDMSGAVDRVVAGGFDTADLPGSPAAQVFADLAKPTGSTTAPFYFQISDYASDGHAITGLKVSATQGAITVKLYNLNNDPELIDTIVTPEPMTLGLLGLGGLFLRRRLA